MIWLRRVIWLLGLFVPAVCYIFTLRIVFAAVFCLAALLPLFSLCLLLSCRKLSASVVLPESAAKQEPFDACILLRGKGPLSSLRVRVRGRAANLLTGEISLLDTEEFSPVHGGAEARLSILSPRCGKLSVDILQIEVCDLLGLFRRKWPVNAHAGTLVLPACFEPQIELSAPDTPDIESDEYSALRPGDDPSELFGIRDYREGDRLKSIHWKLSEKYDRLMVKEMSLPVAQSILLLLDNCPMENVHPDAAAQACEALISVSQSLADLNIAHCLGFFSRETGMMQLSTISGLDELSGEQGLLLSSRIISDDEGIVSRMLEDPCLNPDDYRRVLIFAPCATRGCEALPGDVTLLLPDTGAENALCCLPEQLTRILI